MDFLKSAVASAIAKGSSFPYAFGDRVDVDQSIWALYNGTKREDGSKCSIFSFDITKDKSRLPLARNALRKLRTIRHPGVIKVLDTAETDTYIYIATERVTPLSWFVRRKSLAEETIKWGLHSVARTVSFINEEASSVHGYLRVASIFSSESGEWKLGGFDILSSMKEDDAVVYTYGSMVPDFHRYAPPEVSQSGWDVIKCNPLPAPDSYSLGILINEVFTGSYAGSDQISQIKNIPPSMQQSYRRLTNANPKVRMSVKNFLEQGQRAGGFFDSPLIRITEGVESLGLKSEEEREEFLGQLDSVSDDFPEEFFKVKILPELIKSLEFGGGGPKVLGLIMKISQKMSDDEYNAQITPVIVRLFGNPDRALRVSLLDNLPLMIDHLTQKVVNDKIFPQMVTGFSDLSPVVREQTVKAVLTVVQKLSDRIINGELLRHLAKTANDEQPGIRTNTTICLGKIARNLAPSSRSKVLTAAFSRSLRDPFVHARNAALLALAATSDLFSEDDCAAKILPSICPSLVDKEKLVRDQASKTLDIYLQRVRKYAQTLPDTALPPPGDTNNSSAPRVSTPNNADGSSWTGWAISSFTNKLSLAKGEIQPEPEKRPSSAPLQAETPRSVSSPGSASALHKQAVQSTPALPLQSSQQQDDVVEDDPNFGTGWDDEPTNDPWDIKSTPADDPWDTKPKAPASTASFADSGEPDFAGWLNAQQKSKTKAPLPKGLAKTKSATAVPTRTTVSGAKTTPLAAKKPTTTPAAKPKPAVAKTAAPAPQTDVNDDEGWGDAWE